MCTEQKEYCELNEQYSSDKVKLNYVKLSTVVW